MKSKKPTKETFPRNCVNSNEFALPKRKGVLELKTFTHVEFPVHECINILYNKKYSQNKDLTSMRLFFNKISVHYNLYSLFRSFYLSNLVSVSMP